MATVRQAQPSAMILGILGAAGMLGAAAYAATRHITRPRRGAAPHDYTPPPPSLAATGALEGVQPVGTSTSPAGRQLASNDSSIEDSEHVLISSARVEGTPVYNRDNERLGAIHSVMIHKSSGQVAYALMSFGGFLGGLWGMGRRVHPLPWEMLTYDPGRHGYVVDLDRQALEVAPTLSLDHTDRPSAEAYETDLYTLHGATRYWQSWSPPI